MDIPEDLIYSFQATGGHGVVAFVGSGPSCDAGVPGWADLIRRVAVELSLDADIDPYIKSGRFLEAAEYLSAQRSEAEVRERVAKEIRRVERPGRLHELIVRAPFSAIVTTNYDLLLTAADQRVKYGPPLTYRAVSVRDHFYRSFLLHLHGHVNEPDSIILTRKGYDEIVTPRNAAARQFLFHVLGAYTMLFIGFGFRDLNIDAILRDGDQLGTVGYTTVFGLVPATHVDPVLSQNLRTRKVNAIYVEDVGDHGTNAICVWLANLTRSVENIARSRITSVRARKPVQLLSTIETLFLRSEWQPLVLKGVARLSDRPDLRAWAREGLSSQQVKRLFDEVSAEELRQILVTINTERRSSQLEDILSCFPPQMPDEARDERLP